MLEPVSVYTPGIIACIEMFTLLDEELRQFVVYTYYDRLGEPLYVGASKRFYDAHYFNSERLPFWDEVEYIGFVFMENEKEIRDAKRYYTRARRPKYGRGKYSDLPCLEGLDTDGDAFVVSVAEMEQRWIEWLGPADEFDTQWAIDEGIIDANKECCGNCAYVEGRFCIVAGDDVDLTKKGCSEWEQRT